MITFKNGRYLSDDFVIQNGNVTIDNGRIVSLGGNSFCGEAVDLHGNLLSPGFVDIHIHGANGIDVMTGSAKEIAGLAEFLTSTGTTSFFPTTTAAETNDIVTAIENVREAAAENINGAAIDGVHIEGPFVSRERKGAFNPSFLHNPVTAEYDLFRKAAGNALTVRVTAAPELDGAPEFFRYVRAAGGFVSIGHTNGFEKDARHGLENGANCFTHLFNAMRGIHHREPGIAGTAIDSSAYVELICDGIHVAPPVMRMAFNAKGTERIALITDAMPAMGLNDGEFMFCGYKVHVKNGKVTKDDGAMAGSTLTMLQAVKNTMEFANLSLAHAIRCATLIPARAVGLDNKIGSISVGKRADLVVLNSKTDIEQVYCSGQRVYVKP